MSVVSLKCPNCDGELIFDPATQKYKCEYCNSLFTQEELPVLKQEEAEDQSFFSQDSKAVGYSCPSCGAEIITDATTAATFCYYCHHPVVLGGRLSGEFLPDKVIPFEVTREEAIQGFLDYVGKKKFVPKAFFEKRQIDSMTGVYFPYWLYDVKLEGSAQAEAKNIRVWRAGDMEYTQTKFYAVQREGDITLSNLPENALQKANAALARGVMPYHFETAKKFHMSYLSGFFAEKRDIERINVQNKMQSEMRESAERLVRETISGYHTVNLKSFQVKPKKESWSYVLLPVWTITYKGRDGRIYYYSMNGQTGQVCGELPIDKVKLAAVSTAAAIAVLLLGLIGGFFL